MIDSALKEEMVVEAQRIKLKYMEKDMTVLVQTFREIGKSWKMDGLIKNAKKIRLRMECSIPKETKDTNVIWKEE